MCFKTQTTIKLPMYLEDKKNSMFLEMKEMYSSSKKKYEPKPS